MKVLYALLYAVIWTVAWLPLCVLYVFSDIFFVLAYYVVRYRRKVVETNLRNSFPEKSEKERRRIARKFYLHFCDVFVETLHMMHISEKEMLRRMKFTNFEVLHDFYAQNRNAILMLGHYGNWEYMVASSLYVKERNFIAAGVYRKMDNKFFDDFFLKIRTLFGTVEIEKHELFRKVYEYKKKNVLISFAMMSDQTPSMRNISYWTTFLNQDTPVLVGGERIARKLDYGLFYIDIEKKKRGCYEATIVPVDMDVPSSAEFEDTEKYIRLMEKTIRREPAYWLWTHKRWKHKRNEAER